MLVAAAEQEDLPKTSTQMADRARGKVAQAAAQAQVPLPDDDTLL